MSDASTTPSPLESVPASEASRSPSLAVSWTLFLAGGMAAAVALGVAWRLGAPPLSQVSSRLTLGVWLGAYVLPLLIMLFSAALSWSKPGSPRLVMLVIAALYGGVVADEVLALSDDLYHGASRGQAMVLGVYDCDDPSAGLALTCVELAWQPRYGTARRERYLMPDQQMPRAPLQRGRCVSAVFWERLDLLRELDVTASAQDCRALLKRLRVPRGG